MVSLYVRLVINRRVKSLIGRALFEVEDIVIAYCCRSRVYSVDSPTPRPLQTRQDKLSTALSRMASSVSTLRTELCRSPAKTMKSDSTAIVKLVRVDV